MTLDQALLDKARTEAARLAEAERQTLLTRGDYHAAVRRLHLGGGSLREIAEALGVSHQRVQQIVDATGGSWWQRVWKTRNTRDAACICTYCDRPASEVAKLIAGPNVYICDRCVAAAEATAAGKAKPAIGQAKRCAFCSRTKRDGRGGRRIVTESSYGICTDCLEQCRKILDDRTP
jgi:hypothetical protein